MKKKFSGPQIVAKFRQADILIGQGKKIQEVCKDKVVIETPEIWLPQNNDTAARR
jgi:hypothetical protein